jgi:hypothetical protein
MIDLHSADVPASWVAKPSSACALPGGGQYLGQPVLRLRRRLHIFSFKTTISLSKFDLPMHTIIRNLLLPLLAGAAIASAQAAPHTGTSADYGSVIATSAVDKVVKVGALTRYVNVEDGQTVRFDVDGQTFTFAFHTWPGDQSVDLAVIAPDGVSVPHVRVYIKPNRNYLG